MLNNKPDTGFRSISSTINGLDSVYAPVLDFCSLCNSAGNEGTDGYATSINDQTWLGIGAVSYRPDGSFAPQFYSSISNYIDFCGVAPIYIPNINGNRTYFDGTSCAAPLISGMMALVNHFFIKHIGRSLSQSEMYNFIKSHCVDVKNISLSTDGKDIQTGWGVPILPNPSTINVNDWIEKPVVQKYYKVQLGAFKNKSYCQAFLETVKAKGFDTYMPPLDSDGFYRVQVGAYTQESNAVAMKNKLISSGFSDAFIVYR
jgi:hypothetical protein